MQTTTEQKPWQLIRSLIPCLVAVTGCLLATSVVPCTAFAGAQGPTEEYQAFHLEGNARVSVEHYKVDGDPTQSPFRYLDYHSYGQLDFFADWRFSPYHHFSARFLGLYNDSQYRSSEKDAVVERVNLLLENGASRVPYRIEAGDAYAYFSQRSMQRPIKGIQGEIQSPLSDTGRMFSLQVMGGSFERSWRDVRVDDDFAAGASWLVQGPKVGSWHFTYLNHRRKEDPTRFLSQRIQKLISVAAHVPIRLGDERVTVSGEMGRLWQDFSAQDDPRLDEEISDVGTFFQVAHRGRHPFSWRVRFEDYGADFDPAGAPILNDRRIGEAHVGWRFPTGARLRGRYIILRDDVETENPLDRIRTGVSLSGRLWSAGSASLSTYTDVFREDFERRDLATDLELATLDSQLFLNHGGAWSQRFRLFWQDSNDLTALDNDRNTLELRFSSARAISAGGFSGSIAPGVLYRRVHNGIETTEDWQPTLSVNLSRGGHSLIQTLDLLSQDRRDAGTIDVDTISYRALYRLRKGPIEATFGFETFDRDPSLGEGTNTYRTSFSLAYYIDFYSQGKSPVSTHGSAPPTVPGTLYLSELLPGMPIRGVIDRVAKAGLGKPRELGNLLSWDTNAIDDIHQRQSLEAIRKDGRLERVALVIEPEDTSNERDFLSEFERIREVFMNRYGRATRSFDQGELGPDVALAVNSSQVYRILEWRLDETTLRLGIPRRLDGSVRIELQHARQMPDIREPLWSIADAPR